MWNSAGAGGGILTGDGLTVARFTGPRDTPGDVGVALSGGGTRAALAAWGQIRALRALGYLAKTKALSSCSGGSWFSVPFTFLPDSFDEDAFFGPWIADPGRLTWSHDADGTGVLAMGHGCFGVPFDSLAMSLPALVAESAVLGLGRTLGYGWNAAIGVNLLRPYGLQQLELLTNRATGTFAADPAEAEAIRARNPELQLPIACPREDRPFMVVNTTMQTSSSLTPTTYVPCQITPWFVGVVGQPLAAIGGERVGGGGIESFAFGSEWASGWGSSVDLRMHRPFTLTDATGISSSAVTAGLTSLGDDESDAHYTYFPVAAASPASTSTPFVDGGAVEDSGVAALLAYEDVHTIVAFVNSFTDIAVNKEGVLEIDVTIPPLFGHIPDASRGYPRYPANPLGEKDPAFANNQVFDDHGALYELIAALKNAWLLQQPTAHLQTLTTVDNPTFGVKGGRQVRVLWVHLSSSGASGPWPCTWPIRKDLFDELPTKFPNYPTTETRRTTPEANLLAAFSGWVVSTLSPQLDALYADPA